MCSSLSIWAIFDNKPLQLFISRKEDVGSTNPVYNYRQPIRKLLRQAQDKKLSPVLPIIINAFLQKATSLRKEAKNAKIVHKNTWHIVQSTLRFFLFIENFANGVHPELVEGHLCETFDGH